MGRHKKILNQTSDLDGRSAETFEPLADLPMQIDIQSGDYPFVDNLVYVIKESNKKQKRVFTKRTWEFMGKDKGGWIPDYQLPKTIMAHRDKTADDAENNE
jgi:hypothetical protein